MTVDIMERIPCCSCSEAASIPHPDDVVDEAITRGDDVHYLPTSSSDVEDNSVMGSGVYAMIELGASNKPRYRLDKIQNYLYTASNEIRRTEDGGYVSRSERRRATSMDAVRSEVETSKRCSSTSSSSSGGLRRKLNGALKVVQKYKDAVQSGIRFRELKDSASVTSSSGSR